MLTAARFPAQLMCRFHLSVELGIIAIASRRNRLQTDSQTSMVLMCECGVKESRCTKLIYTSTASHNCVLLLGCGVAVTMGHNHITIPRSANKETSDLAAFFVVGIFDDAHHMAPAISTFVLQFLFVLRDVLGRLFGHLNNTF